MSKNKHQKNRTAPLEVEASEHQESNATTPETEVVEEPSKVAADAPANEIPQSNEPEPVLDYKQLYEEQIQAYLALLKKTQNAEEELTKFKATQAQERQQLIQKLEEKSKQAQTLVQEKTEQLEKNMQSDVLKLQHKFATDLLLGLLDPILLLESSVLTGPKDNPAICAYLQGYKMIVNMFQERLNDLGVTALDVKVGDAFDANLMTAFDVVQDAKTPPNKVLKIVSKGFCYNKKIIKYTSVVVSK